MCITNVRHDYEQKEFIRNIDLSVYFIYTRYIRIAEEEKFIYLYAHVGKIRGKKIDSILAGARES